MATSSSSARRHRCGRDRPGHRHHPLRHRRGRRDRRRRRFRGGGLGRRPSSGPQATASAGASLGIRRADRPSTRRLGRRRSGTSMPATTDRRPTRCTARFPCSSPTGRTSRTGSSSTRPVGRRSGRPAADTWIAEVAGVELDYVVAHGRDPAASAGTTHRPDRTHRAAAPVGDRLPPVPLGVRLGGDAAWRCRRVRPQTAALRLDSSRHLLHGRPSGVHVGSRAIPRSGRVGRRPRTARDAMCDDRRSRCEARAGQRGVRRTASIATSSSTTRPASWSPATCGQGVACSPTSCAPTSDGGGETSTAFSPMLVWPASGTT